MLIALAGLGLEVNAAESTIVAFYQNCQPVSHTIFIDENRVAPIKAGLIIAEAESKTAGLDMRSALPRIIKVLERHGIQETEINHRGNCVSKNKGRFVEAVGAYCGEVLTSAEIHVDGKLFIRRSEPSVTLDVFIANSVTQLRKSGIWDQPRVTISNAPECVEESSG